MRVPDEMLYCVVVLSSVNTAAAAAAAVHNASQFDVVVPHPEHFLLVNLGPCSTTQSVLVS